MDNTSSRNWDYIDPKIINAFDEICRYSEQLELDAGEATGKNFLMFKDKIKLQKTFQKAKEKTQILLESQKDKMIEYLDSQLEFMSKRSAPHKDMTIQSMNFQSSRRSFHTTLKGKTLNRNLSADDLQRYDDKLNIPRELLPVPTKNETCKLEDSSADLVDDPNLASLNQSFIAKTTNSCSNSFEADISIPEYLQRHRKVSNFGGEGKLTHRDSDSMTGANSAQGRDSAATVIYGRDSTVPRDSQKTIVWNDSHQDQLIDRLRSKINTLQAELEAKKEEIERLKYESDRSIKFNETSIDHQSNRIIQSKLNKASTERQALSFHNTSTQETTAGETTVTTRNAPSIVYYQKESRGVAQKRKIQDKIVKFRTKKDRRYQKLYSESRELIDKYETAVAELREKFGNKRLILEKALDEKVSLQQELNKVIQDKELITEKFSSFKENMLNVLNSVQEKLAKYNDKDEAYNDLLEENNKLRTKYEEILKKYSKINDIK